MTAELEQEFAAFLANRGLKLTHQRRAVLGVLPVSQTHFDFDTEYVVARLRQAGVSRDTVYRTLPLLVEWGVLRQLPHWPGRHARYEWIHGREQHDHLICQTCGTMTDVVSPPLVTARNGVCAAHGFRPTHHVLSVYGVCGSCEDNHTSDLPQT